MEYNTWEPAKHLKNACKTVNTYLKRKKRAHLKWDDLTAAKERSA